MKKTIFLLTLLLSTLMFHSLKLETQEGSTGPSVGQITYDEIAQIENRTIRDFALYSYETGASPEEILYSSDFVPRDGERFVAIGDHLEDHLPVLGVSPVGSEGVVATSLDGTNYDTSDTKHSTTFSELETVLNDLYEN